MDLKQVEILLEKYWEGNSSVEEEGVIKDFFAYGEVPEHLEMYRELFLSQEFSLNPILGREFDEEIIEKVSNEPILSRWNAFKIAAVGLVLIIASISVFQMDNQVIIAEDTTETPEEALAETKRAFLLIADAMMISEQQVMMFSKLDKTNEKIKKKE